MRFSKLQATGNDFILVDARNVEAEWAKLARAMCDRHFGAGADGLILVQGSTNADLKMRLFNSDGSEAEISGNGLRCFAKYVLEGGFVGKTSSRRRSSYRSLTVDTLSGVRRLKAHMRANKVSRVDVNMGMPRFQPEEIPVKVKVDIIPILSHPVVIDRTELALCVLSMGNPHAVSFLSRSVAEFPLTDMGPKVEGHAMFPERTNFEVARVLNKERIEARVWERGVGETLACGSGASAIAVAAQLLGYVGREVDIVLPGGILTVSWDGAGEVLLTGPVQGIFTGEWCGERNP